MLGRSALLAALASVMALPSRGAAITVERMRDSITLSPTAAPGQTHGGKPPRNRHTIAQDKRAAVKARNRVRNCRAHRG